MENISEVVSLNPQYIGFILYPASERYLGDDKTIRQSIRAIKSAYKVGVFVNEHYRTIMEEVEAMKLNYVQLHGNETPEFCYVLNKKVPVIKAFNISADFDFKVLSEFECCCEHFLFDAATTKHGGSGQSFDWQLLKQYKLSKKYFLSGGISLENIKLTSKIKDKRLMAIDVNSCFEDAPGIKNINKLNTLINEIRD